MCGIIGCISNKSVQRILLDGLKRLEYRGYDSAGIVIHQNNHFQLAKAVGKLSVLENFVAKDPLLVNSTGTLGIGHTRWATHGAPSTSNAHPHLSCDKRIALVHNGIIENYRELKQKLIKQGHKFRSETDTEVIVHLIEEFRRKYEPLESIKRAVRLLNGSFALAIIFRDFPDKLFAVRLNSPLVIGLCADQMLLASDIPALLPYTNRVVYLKENTFAELSARSYTIYDFKGAKQVNQAVTIDWDITAAEKEGYPHFMLKEIHEQPHAIKSTLGAYLDKTHKQLVLKCFEPMAPRLKKIKRIIITACGTAGHAGLIGKYALEEFTRVPVEVCASSEFRYSNPVLDRNTLVLAISQSGETADTLAAIRLANQAGALTIAICNVVGSSVTREVRGTLYTYAGPEISVASTKAYTTQLMALFVFTLWFKRLKGIKISGLSETRLINEMEKLPDQIQAVLKHAPLVKSIAERYKGARNYMYIARGYNLANAYEGALKLKEIAYVHAEGYGAGEMKHGPLALVDNTFPTIAIALQGKVYDKMLSNIQEIKARQGIIIALVTTGDKFPALLADKIIYLPQSLEMFSPILAVIPLQLLAYYSAVQKGHDVDQPRNLAKSVTVE
jgi:glutamine---fructose-6-phosphate transaminase (isomerizing)